VNAVAPCLAPVQYSAMSQPPIRRGSDRRVLPTRWMMVASSQTWIGEIDAPTEAEAVKKAAEKFNLNTAKLMAVRRNVRSS
jgi:hypothetical protein